MLLITIKSIESGVINMRKKSYIIHIVSSLTLLLLILITTGTAHANHYTPFIKGKKKLGFKPSKKFIEQIYWSIKQRYPTPVGDKTIFSGAKGELKSLLKAYGINPSGIDSMPADGSILTKFRKKYGKKVNRDLSYYACARGMVKGLDDTECDLILPSESKDPRRDEIPQGYGGLGILIEKRNGKIVLIHPFVGGPGKKAGLKPGDVFLSINNKSTRGIDLDTARRRLIGKIGNNVKVVILRGNKKFAKIIKREKVKIVPVHAGIDKNNIGYIKVVYFSMDVPTLVYGALNTFKKKGVKKWILDLKDNSGGAINAVINFGGLFIARKKPVMYIKYRKNNRKITSNFEKNYMPPSVIVVNNYTTGSAEVISGTLREVKGSRIFGLPTQGHTSVAEYIKLNGGATLKLTVGFMLTAKGKSLRKRGLNPDVKIPGANNPANDAKTFKRVMQKIR
ncbi:MAG: PDZ domain-containing protein [Candidatus Eremiobacteraeota bacterium]|nr:PDZ domain-containing protein [Candidatus Eremiobacteraeota bacterium]